MTPRCRWCGGPRTRGRRLCSPRCAIAAAKARRAAAPVQPPKPPPKRRAPRAHGRWVDPAALRAYVEACERRCEVMGCPERVAGEPHHLTPRSAGGPDVAENLLALCWTHHMGPEGWHPLGPRRWFARVKERLAPEAAAKVAAYFTRHPRMMESG